MERVRRFEVKLVLCIETRSRNVVHARPKRLRSVVLYFVSFYFPRELKLGFGNRVLRFGIG